MTSKEIFPEELWTIFPPHTPLVPLFFGQALWSASYLHLLFTDDQKWLWFLPLFRFDAVLVLGGYIIKCTYELVNFMVLIF